MQDIKRRSLGVLALLPLAMALSACKASAMGQRPQMTAAQRRLKNMGLTLVVDAVEGAEMLGVEFFADESDRPFYARSVQRKSGRAILAFPSAVTPEQVRVVWRDSAKIVGRTDNPRINTYAGNILGDYTIPIASRIPDEVVREIRKNGGGLRLKFRLKSDGVLFGWDIERIYGGLPRHSLAGGDFREADLAYELPDGLVYEHLSPKVAPYLATGEYFIPPRASAVWRKGWYIDTQTGQKILTNF